MLLKTQPDATPDAPRERLLFDLDWQFHFGDPPDAGDLFDYPEREQLTKTWPNYLEEEAKLARSRINPVVSNLGGNISWVQPAFNDSNWRTLNLPHDWFVELPFKQAAQDGHIPTPGGGNNGSKDVDPQKGFNIGWYRRTFNLPASDAGKILSLEMDGVFRNSLVWLNGHCLGRHVSGYTSFAYDLTRYAIVEGKNVLVVRVDASRSTGWFYEGGGIYRHVWLVKTNPLHVARWGTYVVSEILNDGNAQLSIETTVRNDGNQAGFVHIISTVFDQSGHRVAEVAEEIPSVDEAREQVVHQKVLVHAPQLWSVDTPVMYSLVSRVTGDGELFDEYETPFGIRTLHFDPERGFFLNGKHVLLKGTCNHQDHAGLGTALPDRVQWFRIERLKEIGSNAYRTSHNPPTPELLDACDHLGMLVMVENRNMGTTPEMLDDLKAMVLRDRNHPSVFIWSLGNEEGHLQGDDVIGVEIVKTMTNVVRGLDPSRLSTVAISRHWGEGFSRVIEVMGYNYWRQGNVDKYHEDFYCRPSLSTEDVSAFATRGYYGEQKNGYCPAYDVINEPGTYRDTVEHTIQYYASRPFIAGFFAWTGFDYRGEPSPFGWPQISSNYGTLDTCGFMKDNAYLYQAWWGAKPVLHIFPHWNWTGEEDKPICVWAASNCDEVELLLNGRSLGRKVVPKYGHLEWQVAYTPGTLMGKGYKQGKEILRKQIETTGAPAGIQLIPHRKTLHGDGEDVSLVTVQVADAHGRIVPDANNMVDFHIDGGKIIGVGNGDPVCHEPDQAERRSVFNGLAQVIVQAPRNVAKIILTAKSPTLETSSVIIDVDSRGPRPSVPPLCLPTTAPHVSPLANRAAMAATATPGSDRRNENSFP